MGRSTLGTSKPLKPHLLCRGSIIKISIFCNLTLGQADKLHKDGEIENAGMEEFESGGMEGRLEVRGCTDTI